MPADSNRGSMQVVLLGDGGSAVERGWDQHLRQKAPSPAWQRM